MRCKEGDLAIIVNEFEGCEGNLGVIVKLVGPAEKHSQVSMICWPIHPVKKRKLWLINENRPASYDFVSKDNPAFHPDAWLIPISGYSPKEIGQPEFISI